MIYATLHLSCELLCWARRLVRLLLWRKADRFNENVGLLVIITQLSLGESVVAPSSEFSIWFAYWVETKLSELLAERNSGEVNSHY